MLKELLRAWRKRDPMSQMLRQVDEMLAHGQWMFGEACAVLEGSKPASAVDDALHERDHEINRLQREIRRQVLTHLTVEPESNIPACLALMSIVKDAERIGDYCKNIFELGEMYTKPLDHGRYTQPLRDIRDEILRFFQITREAFSNSDEARAREVVHRKMVVSKETDLLISQLVRDQLGTADAVAYALLARHFKRVSSHLANIASSVFAPLDAIDYSDEPGPVDLEPPAGE